MDPASSYLGRVLLEDITPVVMVLSTPHVEEACQKNGLSFVELLRPFCEFDNIDVPVRTASDQPYRLQTFKLRVFYASDIRLQNDEVAVNRLKEVVINASQSVLSDMESEPPQLDKLTSLTESDVQPSWLQKINRDLAEAVSFSDHEAFDHPVACLLVVSSKDDNPMNKFVDFFNTNQIPSVLNDSMDPKILKYYLLLHDRQDGPTEKANTMLSEIRGTFGLSDCRLLCINSGMNEIADWREYPWSKYKTDFPGDKNTCFLGLDDLNETKVFMQDLSSKKIIPHMEQKIRILNQQVSATRRGFRNQIKNLWWRKGKEDTTETPSGPTYTFSSIESQIRVLGDYAFMLRDYELALSNYRLLSTDYKLDKAWKRYAGVQEMMGLSLFMLDQSRKDSEYCMETAFQTYVRLGPSGLRNATRCGVWWAEMLKARGQYKEAADVYFKISMEDPSLHAAVMLEQSSYCYLSANPPMLRKFGFHLVLAGNRYYISDQREHALRTYRFALSVYRGNAWNYINDHVNYNIGRWYAFIGMFDAATKHMLEILECSHQSLATQDLFLKDFQRIVQNMGRKLSVPKLQLPSINMSSIEVIFEDHRTYASPAAARVRENVWQILEENMVPSTTTKTNWLHSKKFPSKKYGDDYISVLGEPIKVYVEMKNPLRISIPISGVSLICEYSARPVKSEAEDAELVNEESNLIYAETLSSSKYDDIAFFELSQIDFELGGGERRKVQLEVTPKVEGFLKIVGVRWVLSGFVDSYRYFETDIKNNRKGRRYMNLSRNNMSFAVIKGLPKLEGLIMNFPRKTFAGDLRPLVLKLENHAKYSIKNLKMMISHPRFLVPGTAGSLGLKFPDCLHKSVYLEESADQSNIVEKREGLPFLFPSDVIIQGGKVLEWPLWLHSAVSGNISLYISLYYEIEGSFEMNHRTLRMYYELEVSPSLDLSIVVTPCADSLQEFIVRFEIASKMTAESLWLRQLSSVGCRWKLSALRSFDYDGPQLLVAGQALSCFFKLKESSTKSDAVSDMILGSVEENELILDVSKRPLTDFHHQEKIHQSSQDQSTGTMDFVLISQLVYDGANMENNERDQVQLLSHHACGSSILGRNPIWLLMCGPQETRHDFSAPFCITSFHLTVYNYSEFIASIKISTFEAVSDVKSESTAASPRPDILKNQRGWQDISLDTNDGSPGRDHSNVLSDVTTPFLWCGASSRVLQLQPMSLAKVPFTICIFSPGVYNLSAYEVCWNLHIPDGEGATDMKWQASGVSKGHPYYYTVLQSQKN